MYELGKNWVRILHPRRLDPSVGAVAGVVSAVSVIVGYLAQRAMGHGWHKAFIALHVVKRPMIVRLAPFFTGTAIAIVTAGALLRFYNWYREKEWRRPLEPERDASADPRAGGIDVSSTK
ncbi:MAG: hypothetical protein ABJC66_08985 [Gammaproteobacteria bacterium]